MAATARHRLLVLEAALCLASYRLALKLLPFRKLAETYQRRKPITLPPSDARVVIPIKIAVESAVRHLPFACTCLCQALTAGRMLRRRGISSSIFIGAALDNAGEFESHAWIESGSTIVAGATDVKRYKIMMTLSA